MFDNLQEHLRTIILLAAPILAAITVHEAAHGWAAYRFGDDTAKNQGRLTLNPIKHLDPVGTLVLFITRMVGWAKPVPVNPANFRNPRRDMMWVSLAGPGANLALALVFSLFLRLLIMQEQNIPAYFLRPLLIMTYSGVYINIGLAVFNLLPVPPLDGSGIVSGLLPPELAVKYESIQPYGFIILLILIFSNAVDYIIVPIIEFAAQILLTGLQ